MRAAPVPYLPEPATGRKQDRPAVLEACAAALGALSFQANHLQRMAHEAMVDGRIDHELKARGQAAAVLSRMVSMAVGNTMHVTVRRGGAESLPPWESFPPALRATFDRFLDTATQHGVDVAALVGAKPVEALPPGPGR